MSFPHFGYPYGGASQVRAAPWGMGETGRRSTDHPEPARKALLSHEFPGSQREREPGWCTADPSDMPHHWQENAPLPRQVEESCDPKLGTLTCALRRVGGISGTFQAGLLAVQISEVAGRSQTRSLFFWARSFVILCSFPLLPRVGQALGFRFLRFSRSRSGHCAVTGSPGEILETPTPVRFLSRGPGLAQRPLPCCVISDKPPILRSPPSPSIK